MSQQGIVVYQSRPELRNPYLVCGVNGWVNGGEVSVGGVNYLIREFKAKRFAEMPTARFHVYQVPGVESLRPVFRTQDGLIVESQLPRDEFYYATNPAGEHDLILFLGAEPNLGWEEYADAVIGVGRDFGAARLYAFGGVLDRSPYTREPRISCVCTDQTVKNEIKSYNMSFNSREGPATFNQMLVYAAKKHGLEAATFTVRVPYYPEFNVAVDYSPKSIKAVLVRLNQLMHLNLRFEELNKGIRELEGKLDFVRRQNPQFNTFMEEMEKEYVEMPYQEPLDMSANEAIQLAEEFLKGNKDQGKNS